MAARALQLGLVKCLDARTTLIRWHQQYEEEIGEAGG